MIVDFSEADLRLLRELVDRERHRPRNAPRNPGPTVNQRQNPPTLIVRTPAAGIPALSDVGTGTGTGTGTSTATPDDDMVEPGSAECQVFRVNPTSGLLVWAGFSVTVLNANPFAVAGWLFVKATQDRFGAWWAPTLPLRTSTCA